MTPKKWWHFLVLFALVSGMTIAALIALSITLIYPTLPSLEKVTDYNPIQPLRIYSADKYLIGEFGEERRAFTTIDKIPKQMQDAVLAIEDRRFYRHGGVDMKGIARAIRNNITGRSHEGASTITMQVAKNFFTGPNKKRNIITKIKEALLAIKIEKTLEKDQILELYLNQIYLGQRSYGFSAAAQVYFAKPLQELTLAESALLAGLPKAPSGYNPFYRPKKAIARQHEVLRDMQRYGFIDKAQFDEAIAQELVFKRMAKSELALSADYVAELVRQQLYKRYGDDIYNSGLKVYTTIIKANQEAANQAIVDGILEYQQRQGYQKAEKWIDLAALDQNNLDEELQNRLSEITVYNNFIPAIVTKKLPNAVEVFTQNGEKISITDKGLSLLKRNLALKDAKKHKVKRGSVVRIIKMKDGWQIVQLPEVESALVALNPKDGAITALVGGFNFYKSKYNHATQAYRQPGSSFKPFVYSAALEKGFTPASIIEDEPISMTGIEVGSGEKWEPKNYNNEYEGPMRMREALTKSNNMVSIRILESIGTRYAQDYAKRFGFSAKHNPAYLTMALGAGEVTPLELANGYAIFANGGYRVEPHLITKIMDSQGKVLEELTFPVAEKTAPLVIDERNAFIMTSMLRDVVQSGTARRATSLGRQDLAGKTGTTNDTIDAWFAGYTPHQVAVSWMGYDQPRSLGRVETGGRAALPIWIKYMQTALKGKPDLAYPEPAGLMSLRIDPYTGTLSDSEYGINEYFYNENPPPVLELNLPPLTDIFDSGFPVQNPLQPNASTSPNPAPPPAMTPNPATTPSPKQGEEVKTEPAKAPRRGTTSTDNARSVLNPSGF
ncbi:MAG: PBP1A family penicillin-binding protein [Betaproteobacteria bacterium]|nr:PBP1A family penicillin-binding protein [Betaproteobacteria bacterium]MCH9848405.1 PBP1A family penicillin-binding protein [Betaproteobacteria bacterium]